MSPAQGPSEAAIDTLAHGESLPEPAAGTARTIGPYALTRRLGEGGMGEVWLAEQTSPVRRVVALKLIKEGMDSRRVVARFEAERQALAVMDHAAIAKVFDGGSTADGRPYFVMERIAGIPLHQFCERHRLGTRERLGLFLELCDGVQHAHHKAVIHRDLKPSNVLVAMVDGKPLPKIIDFGVAKALAHRVSDHACATELGAMIGTPEYMSPEQAGATGDDIDTRADVYSLGVMLYELLCGSLPFASAELRSASLDELRRTLREVDPPRPSARASTPGARAGAAQPHELRGDLDAIVMKAMAKERARRYQSPAELAADLGRHLRHEPVQARPAGASYRAGRFVRRHRAGVVVAGAALVLLIAFTVGLGVQVREASRARDRADREAAVATRVVDFMASMFATTNPSEARGRTVTARELLDNAAAKIEAGLAGDAEVESRLMATMGHAYALLGLDQRALALLDRAVAAQRRLLGPEHAKTLATRSLRGALLNKLGRQAEAETELAAVLEAQRRVLGREHPGTFETQFQLASTIARRGRSADAEPLLRDLISMQRRLLGPEAEDTLASLNDLAALQIKLGRYAEAEPVLRELLQTERRVLGPEHIDTLNTLGNLAGMFYRMRRFPEAEARFREHVALSRRVLGVEHPDTQRAMVQLANTLDDEQRPAEAETLYRDVLAIQRRVLPRSHPRVAVTLYNLAGLEIRQGRKDDGLSHLRESIDSGMEGWLANELADEPDFASVHGDPAFESLVQRASEIAR